MVGKINFFLLLNIFRRKKYFYGFFQELRFRGFLERLIGEFFYQFFGIRVFWVFILRVRGLDFGYKVSIRSEKIVIRGVFMRMFCFIFIEGVFFYRFGFDDVVVSSFFRISQRFRELIIVVQLYCFFLKNLNFIVSYVIDFRLFVEFVQEFFRRLMFKLEGILQGRFCG